MAFVSGLALTILPVQAVAVGAVSAAPDLVGDPASLVNPLIGTSGKVDTFPGPDMPFGMLQWGPDTTPDMSSVMTGGRPPCLPLRAAVSSPSTVDSRMSSRSVSAIAAKNANGGLPAPLGS
ncbi:hypothetical protein [Streptomyces sp. x-80]|uniref:hypothetical protein n=1 Tax=Streptomyces sp. x-80 TaxID=2789282 RepID=UPI003980CF32